jgi:threonine/homoserine/homoserine lactone efflux protein
MLAYYLLGVALGAGSSVIPGPCGLAVIDAATRLGTRRAIATAIGSGLGDLSYAAVGVFGIGQILAEHHALVTIMLAIGGSVLIVYGLGCLYRRPPDRVATPVGSLGGLAVGFATLVSNPGVLVTWSVVVGTQVASGTHAEQLCAVIGIGSGSLAWFVGMAYVASRGRAVLGGHLQRIVQLVGLLIVAYGMMSIGRAVDVLRGSFD